MSIQEYYRSFYNEKQSREKAEFDKKLICTNYEIKGVKTLELEEFAKELVKQGFSFFDLPLQCHEDILIAGMFIKFEKNIKKKLLYLQKLLNYIDNWATCDMIACRLKDMKKEKNFFYELLNDSYDFKVRFAIVWLKSFELRGNLENVLQKIVAAQRENYFVKMAQAWTIAEGFVVDFEKTLNIFKNCDDKFVANKSIQKACESFRITKEQKEFLKKLKK